MRIGVLWKRRYMGHDVIADRYARLYELPRGLAESGHSVLGLCLGYKRSSWQRREDAVSGSGSLTWQGYDSGALAIAGLPAYWRSVRDELRAFVPDLLLGGSDAIHAVLTQELARQLKIPYVLDLYDNFESFGLTRIPGLLPLYRRALRGARGIAAVSEPLAEYVQTVAPDVAVTTLESTIDPDVFFPRERQTARLQLGLPEHGRLLGVSGSLSRNRGIDLVYRAFLQLAATDDSLHLALAGDIDRHAPPPSHPRLHFLGRIRHADMPVFFSAIDLAVVPMIDTPFGRYAFPQKAYEIIACGTPIVTARLGALAQTLSAYPECLYEAGSLSELEQGIRQQLTHPRTVTVDIPSWRDQADKLGAFMADVCAHS